MLCLRGRVFSYILLAVLVLGAPSAAQEGPEDWSDIEVLEVVGQPSKKEEAVQLLRRMKAAALSDNLGAEMIKKSPDSDAAEVVARVPAVTVKDDKFIFVRGLGERYSSALLDGSRLPSTDPNKRVVSLDLFPADFIQSLSVIKSYTPDLPADFSGGLVNIELEEFPERLSCGIGLSTSGSTATTFQGFDTYEGSALDYFGFGAGFRELPGIIPDEILTPRTPGTVDGMRAIAGSFRNVWSVDSITAPPNFSVNFSIGNSFGPLGAQLGAVYSTEYEVRRDELARSFFNTDLSQRDDFVYDRSTFETRLGAVLTGAYELRPAHTLGLRALVNRSSSDEVLDGQGLSDNLRDRDVFQTRLQYTEEQLSFGQIAGAHRWQHLQLDWRSALSQTTQDQPDTRHVVRSREQGSSDPPQLSFVSPSLLRTFSDLEEHLSDSALDLTVPFSTRLPFTDAWSGLPASFKTGVAYAFRARDFRFRRFLYEQGRLGDIDLSAPVEQLLVTENIGPRAQFPFQFTETTQKADEFESSQEIAAAYGMLELPLVHDRLRLIGGVRAEYSFIAVDGFDRQSRPIAARIKDIDPFPAASLVLSPREDMNFRYAFSLTTSRPEFRELTPTEFPVPGGERTVIGNPNLLSAAIENHDLRWEWFFSPTEVVSVSLFYKEITDAIEQVALSQTSRAADSFRNTDARLYGLELEARKELASLRPWVAATPLSAIAPQLDRIGLLANVSVIDSKADLSLPPGLDCRAFPSPPECTEIQSSSSRRFVGQAPFTVNAVLEYRHPRWGTTRLLYNTIGRRIVAAGINDLPDIFEERRDQLDLVWMTEIAPFQTPLKLKLAVENILDDPVEHTQELTVRRYRTGTKFGIGISHSF